MRRNKVRLTESQLHNVIKESVKQILSELDWKTYFNAGKKRLLDRTPKNKKYANGFDSLIQAEKAFNDEYGDNVDYDEYGHREFFDEPEKQGITRTYGDVEGQYDGYPERIRMQAKTDLPNVARASHGTITSDPKFNYSDDSHAWYFQNQGPEEIERRLFNREKHPIIRSIAQQNHDRAKKEIEDFENGNYEYIKGKGWQKKH